MRHLFFVTAFALSLPVLANPDATSNTPDVTLTPAPDDVKVTVTGAFNLSTDQGRKVFVEFLASPKLTTAAGAALAVQGFPVVEAREQADVVYELDGAFQALRPATRRTAEIRVGDYVENPASLVTKSGRGGSVVLSPNPLAMLIGTIASNVGNATGAQDVVGAAMTGDPDGKCLSRCETWRYRQRAVVNLTRKVAGEEQRCAVLVTADDAALLPARLIQSSFDVLTDVVGLRLAGIDLSPTK